jgi:hypothetical protein
MDPLFDTVKVTQSGQREIKKAKNHFDACLKEIERLVPEGRQLSIVRTNLEEACFHAVKAIANKHKVQ